MNFFGSQIRFNVQITKVLRLNALSVIAFHRIIPDLIATTKLLVTLLYLQWAFYEHYFWRVTTCKTAHLVLKSDPKEQKPDILLGSSPGFLFSKIYRNTCVICLKYFATISFLLQFFQIVPISNLKNVTVALLNEHLIPD